MVLSGHKRATMVPGGALDVGPHRERVERRVPPPPPRLGRVRLFDWSAATAVSSSSPSAISSFCAVAAAAADAGAAAGFDRGEASASIVSASDSWLAVTDKSLLAPFTAVFRVGRPASDDGMPHQRKRGVLTILLFTSDNTCPPFTVSRRIPPW